MAYDICFHNLASNGSPTILGLSDLHIVLTWGCEVGSPANTGKAFKEAGSLREWPDEAGMGAGKKRCVYLPKDLSEIFICECTLGTSKSIICSVFQLI